ncbi:MAG: hypothetical protein JWM14_1462 [Chitinophagaceae bacterium]|nr:hypothetical protein [Chitinophagaceae bacterium]
MKHNLTSGIIVHLLSPGLFFFSLYHESIFRTQMGGFNGLVY